MRKQGKKFDLDNFILSSVKNLHEELKSPATYAEKKAHIFRSFLPILVKMDGIDKEVINREHKF